MARIRFFESIGQLQNMAARATAQTIDAMCGVVCVRKTCGSDPTPAAANRMRNGTSGSRYRADT